MNNSGLAVFCGLVVGIFAYHPSCYSQGPLTPPGPPAPTMKTLDQIEPRTPITNLPVTITQPGSYYLTTNLTGGASGGITIAASGVTLDLMGFELAGGTGDGISVSGSLTNIAVRNGTVRGWSGNGVATFNNFPILARNSQLERLAVSSNAGAGIAAGPGSVKDCTAQSNGNIGISAREGSTVSGCTAQSNGSVGISAGPGSTVSGCTAQGNGNVGITAGFGSTVSGCTASYNVSFGITAGYGSTVSGCTASFNTGDGVRVTTRCSVLNNTAIGNGNTGGAGTQGGIHATDNGNRIDSNHTVGNSCDGILVDSTGVKNFVVRNTSGQNAGFQLRVPGIVGQPPAGANVIGPTVTDATNVNANAWANMFQNP